MMVDVWKNVAGASRGSWRHARVVGQSLGSLAVWGALLNWPDLAQTPAPAGGAPSQSAFTNSGPYMRVARPDTNTVELQIAVRQFLPRQEKGPEVWLAAVSHIGESNYFTQLQAFLNHRDLVLFE